MSLVKTITGSLMLRVSLVIAAMGAMTIAAVAIGWSVFQSIAGATTDFTTERLPLLEHSAQITAAAGDLRGDLLALVTAPDPEALARAGGQTRKTLETARGLIADLPQDRQSTLLSPLADAAEALGALEAARAQDQASMETISAAVAGAAKLEADVASALATAVDSAYFDMVLGAEDAITQVDGNLGSLLDEDVGLLTAALQARAEMNLLSGLALGAVQTADPALRAILADLAQTAGTTLEALVARLAESEDTRASAEGLSALHSRLMPVFTSRVAALSVNLVEIFELRRRADLELTTALDNIGFALAIKGDDAKAANEMALRSLIDEQVRMIRDMAALDAGTKQFFAEALNVALAGDALELGRRQAILVSQGNALRELALLAEDDLRGRIDAMLDLADPEHGIAASRAGGFAASETARQAQEKATENVTTIARLVAAEAARTRLAITEISQHIATQIGAARSRIGGIGLVAFLLLAVAPVFSWLMIVRPLNRITRETERLSSGDLAPVTGLPATGEMGRLAAALAIFRDNAIDQKRLQQEEQERALREREREVAAAEEARRREAEEQRLAREREAEEAARAAQEVERIAAQRAQEEARQAQQSAETRQVVTALAQGLASLSHGDLTHRIEERFPADYEALRTDFNLAIENLGHVIRQVTESVTVVGASSTEIAQASSDLSRRTESTAATLEETAAALNLLTSSVSSSTEGARRANERVGSARESAEKSRIIVTQAVSAMGSIELSSKEISKITSVLDDIAFQTNLLALNAGVEAARAGEAGRGFAVVASEVRALALRAADAASQINGLISESNGHVTNGVASVGQVSEALEQIVRFVEEISAHVAGISATSDEQLSGIAEINSAMGQLDSTTQKNAAMFEQTAAACGALEREARDLAQVVEQFEMPEGEAGGDPARQVA